MLLDVHTEAYLQAVRSSNAKLTEVSAALLSLVALQNPVSSSPKHGTQHRNSWSEQAAVLH